MHQPNKLCKHETKNIREMEEVFLPIVSPQENGVTNNSKIESPKAVIATTMRPDIAALDRLVRDSLKGPSRDSSENGNRKKRDNWQPIKTPTLGRMRYNTFYCEKPTVFAFSNLWNPYNQNQKLFALRHLAIALLSIHFVILTIQSVIYPTKFYNSIPRLTQISATTGIITWILIDGYIIYLFLTWKVAFIHEFPEVFYTILIISVSILALLFYELTTSMEKVYGVSHRENRYIPAAQTENDHPVITLYTA